jgi:MFS family permease
MNSSASELQHKRRTIALLSLAELLGMAVWFSASAVVPSLTEEWSLTDGGRAWLTISVQIGFVVGAFGSAVFNLADRFPSRIMFSTTAILAGVSTAFIPFFAKGLESAIFFRLLAGLFLAGVYPVGMKIMATWTQKDRGLGIGLLVGALTIGSATPHLLNVFGGIQSWQTVLYLSAGLAVAGGLIGFFFIDEGPFRMKTPPFNWRYVQNVLQDREIRLVNLGYLGHMWELYAMWSWMPLFLLTSFSISGVSPTWASLAAFAVIGAGGIGSVIAGKLADRFGRSQVTIGAMVISGGCAAVIGQLFGGNPTLLVFVSLIWGVTVVADSAQFSAAVSELADRSYIGTALTIQTSLGFLLTVVTIRLIPSLESWVGWRWAFSFLVIGPLVGVLAMERLRRSPKAVQLTRQHR